MTKPVDETQNGKQSDSPLQQDSAPTPNATDAHSASHVAQNATAPLGGLDTDRPPEHGGQAGLEPTRYGDWEKKGRCTDF